MKYEYMKEYECNGVKPDLTDDVEIEIKTNRNPDGSSCSWYVGDCVWDSINNPIKSFRIVDPRYKPNNNGSNWHERGEFPPVGGVVEFFQNGQWIKVEVFGHRKNKNGVVDVFVDYLDSSNWSYTSSLDRFRPLRTERHELIAELYKTVTGDWLEGNEMDDQDCVSFCQIAIDAGYRPTKEE